LLLVIAVTCATLAGATVLVGAAGRRRRTRRPAALPSAHRRALAQDVGWALTDLVEQTRALRGRLEAVCANGRDMVDVEDALGASASSRRPLWRQLEDASYERDLERADQALRGWLHSVRALQGSDRRIFDEVAPRLAAVRDLVGVAWAQHGAGTDPRPALRALQARFERAIVVLRDLEGRLTTYRPRIYR
jgi:hypothetical protein